MRLSQIGRPDRDRKRNSKFSTDAGSLLKDGGRVSRRRTPAACVDALDQVRSRIASLETKRETLLSTLEPRSFFSQACASLESRASSVECVSRFFSFKERDSVCRWWQRVVHVDDLWREGQKVREREREAFRESFVLFSQERVWNAGAVVPARFSRSHRVGIGDDLWVFWKRATCGPHVIVGDLTWVPISDSIQTTFKVRWSF